MANPTTNYGFVLPTSSDLVTDLPADFDIALQGVDTRLKALQPGTTLGDLVYSSATANTNTRLPIGTTGQVLAVSGGVPAWTTTADVTPLTTKGDLFTFTTVDARLAVGNNGETLVADSSTSTGLRYTGNFAAGKNKIINGAFDNWQRGTSFTLTNEAYTSDRFKTQTDKTGTISRQTFTPGTAPVAGYEGQYYLRSALNAVGSYYLLNQPIENVQTFAGQTITLSFWARVSSGTATNAPDIIQNFGSGGSASVTTTPSGQTITTDWQRFSTSVAIPSISGKTIGTSSSLDIRVIRFVSASAATIDIWGVQVEAGSVATAFQTATGTLQGELAACQRYYWRSTSGTLYGTLGVGIATSTTNANIQMKCPVTMRVTPTSIDYTTIGNLRLTEGVGGFTCTGTLILSGESSPEVPFVAGVTSTGLTQYRTYFLSGNNTVAAFVGFSAEL